METELPLVNYTRVIFSLCKIVEELVSKALNWIDACDMLDDNNLSS